MKQKLEYQRLKYFLKAAETLNFSEAARQMFVTPQAFGKQIALFEYEIGMPLFESGNRKKKLTYEGEIVYKHMVKAADMLENEYKMMQDMAEKRKNQVNMGFFASFNRQKIVNPIITDVLAAFTENNINIRMYEMGALQRAVLSGELDIGITISNPTEAFWDDYEKVVLKTYETKLVVSLYHDWVVKDQVTIEDMKQCDMVRLTVEQPSKEDVYYTMPCKNTIVVDNYASVITELEQGKCFCVMSPEMDESVERYNLKQLPLPDIDYTSELVIVYNPDRVTPLQLEICQFIKGMFETSSL